ncbi:hypothetical protein Zmor_002936 [Zophobas morio]|uniref:Uncharacterized protein n=1 Tax=Zophobas morio TaxID=2755281 RepID=A0AA38HKD3_9CUCU|nr:hypothetical protein Zmor_002936 [Zophobas morio]
MVEGPIIRRRLMAAPKCESLSGVDQLDDALLRQSPISDSRMRVIMSAELHIIIGQRHCRAEHYRTRGKMRAITHRLAINLHRSNNVSSCRRIRLSNVAAKSTADCGRRFIIAVMKRRY